MSESTAIAWTDATWSPWEGCTKVSPGCDNCYASAMNTWLQKGRNWGPGAPRREYGDEHWQKPLKWNAKAEKAGKRLRVFPSVCDLFDKEARDVLRSKFFMLMCRTPWIDWLLLTKRIGNAQRMLDAAVLEYTDGLSDWSGAPLPNVWLGATVVNQEEADRDIPKLLSTPARLRFLSIEPMLGPINLRSLSRGTPDEIDALNRNPGRDRSRAQIDWVIVGGESGRKARDFDIAWPRSIVKQCNAGEVPVFVKQMGAKPVWHDDDEDSEPPHWGRIQFIDKSGSVPAEWPADLRIQEFPR